MMNERDDRSTVGFLRRALTLLFVFGAAGVLVELLLLGHTEDPWQWTPLVLIAVSLLALLTHRALRRRASLRAVQVVMLLFVAGGLIGQWLHYRGNAEFEVEMYPSLAGWDLFWSSIQGATPALAPGAMIGLGLLGLISTYRHPLLTDDVRPKDDNGGLR